MPAHRPLTCAAGVFIARSGAKDVLVTKNLTPGESVYGEKRITVDVGGHAGAAPVNAAQSGDTKVEYRTWNPFRSKLAAAILGGVEAIHIKPGAKVGVRCAWSATDGNAGAVPGRRVRHHRLARLRHCRPGLSLRCVRSMIDMSSRRALCTPWSSRTAAGGT